MLCLPLLEAALHKYGKVALSTLCYGRCYFLALIVEIEARLPRSLTHTS